MNSFIKLTIISLFILRSFSIVAQTSNNKITVFTDSIKWTISDYLVGMHSVYSNDADAFYQDDKFANWMKDTGINIMRYPGGSIVKYWDWENPNGIANKDSWDPDYSDSNKPAADWMSLDEYISLVKKSGITPLFGVNITSGYRFDKVEESVNRAVKMVEYVKSKGLDGAFWYLGNEGMNGGLESEAHLFVKHAKAMKAIDPNIKCMFNHNNLTPKYLKAYLKIAGDYVDIAETHGKWPYGGNPKKYTPGSFEEWQVESPLRDRKNHNRAWRFALNELKVAATEAGYPNIKFANNEYGTAKASNLLNFDKYSLNLLVIDMLQEHFIGNWYMACYWSVIKKTNGNLTGVVDKSNNYKYNPMHYGFEMLSKAQGGLMLEYKDNGNPSVYGFACKKNGEYLIYIINKSNDTQNVEFSFIGNSNMQFIDVKTLVNTKDGFGKLIQKNNKTIPIRNLKKHNAELPNMSYSLFRFKRM
ncbi:hypothetical protein KH5_15560 [Urechidicola sp. KH5]